MPACCVTHSAPWRLDRRNDPGDRRNLFGRPHDRRRHSGQGDSPPSRRPPPKPTAAGADIAEINKAIDLFKARAYEECLKQLKEACHQASGTAAAADHHVPVFHPVEPADAGPVAVESAVTDTPNDPEAYVILGNAALQDRRLTARRPGIRQGQRS